MNSTHAAIPKTVAVVGGGIFGCATALELARAGFSVTLFEAGSDIMQAASGINQYRMHRGYHYPRSSETILSCMEATPLFEAEYSDAIISHLTHYYAIAKEGSKVSAEEYLATLDRHGLPYAVETPAHLNHDMLEVAVRVEEHLFDPSKLRDLLLTRLGNVGVTLVLNTRVDVDELNEFDFVVVATYANLNATYKNRTLAHSDYQYEVCEKIVVKIPESLKNISTVVMDGPFMCFDPLGDTGNAVMGHVEHAIHHRSVGNSPQIPPELIPYMNNGIIRNPSVTHFSKIIEDSIRFMPGLMDIEHVGSMFTVRTVLPKVDATDMRPTIVRDHDGRVFSIYSGKIGNSVKAARDIAERIKEVIERKTS